MARLGEVVVGDAGLDTLTLDGFDDDRVLDWLGLAKPPPALDESRLEALTGPWTRDDHAFEMRLDGTALVAHHLPWLWRRPTLSLVEPEWATPRTPRRGRR